MSWSVSQTLIRTGAPALGMFAVKTLVELATRDPAAAGAEIIATNAQLFGLVWLGVAALVYILTRLFPPRP